VELPAYASATPARASRTLASAVSPRASGVLHRCADEYRRRPGLGICGVGLRAEDRRARDDLAEQDYLFTLFELGDSDDTEVR
jgi:hypothetical protein